MLRSSLFPLVCLLSHLFLLSVISQEYCTSKDQRYFVKNCNLTRGIHLQRSNSSFLVFAFLSLILYLKLTRINTHFMERKRIHCTACQTDSTLFTQFICHINEKKHDSHEAFINIISQTELQFKRTCFEVFALSKTCPNFYTPCVGVFGSVIFAFMPGAWMDSNTLICLDLSPALNQMKYLHSPNLNMNRCCFIFRGRSALSWEAADWLTSYRTLNF